MSFLRHLLNQPEFKRSTKWLRVRGADSTGKKAKRSIHREERRQTRQQIRQQLEVL